MRLPRGGAGIAGTFWKGGLILVVSAILAYGGMSIDRIDPVQSVIWPATGIGMGLLLWLGARYWPAFSAGLLLGRLAFLGFGPGWVGAIITTAGSTLAVLIAIRLLRTWLPEEEILHKPTDIYRAAVAMAIVAAPIGAIAWTAGALVDGLSSSLIVDFWLRAWLAIMASMMVFVPAFIAWRKPWGPDDPDLRARKVWIQGGFILALHVAVIAIYAQTQGPAQNSALNSALSYLNIGAFVWAVALLGLRGITVSYIVLSAAGVIGVYNGRLQNTNDPAVALITSAISLTVLQLAMVPIGQLVDERRKNRRTLEARVEERTRDLAAAMQQLKTAKEAAEVAAQAKSNFLATMSHEIRTPLNAVIGTAELLETSGLAAEHRTSLATIRNSSEHLLSVINDILDYSKADAGRLQLALAPMRLDRVAQEAIDMAQSRLTESKVEVKLEATGPMKVMGDPHRVRQVLLNYLSNAIKFSPEGTIWVRVHGEGVGRGRIRVRLSVQDPGIGIPPDKQAQLFQPFMQVASTSTRTAGGTGLGLAIVKRVVDAMGGSVSVESEPGKGSTFSAEFVLDSVDHVPDPISEDADVAKLAPLRILLAEDNKVNQQVATRMLLRLGQKADLAGTGTEAVSAALAKPYDLILMDLHMPEMDGLDATRQIRKKERGRRTRIVAMTADALEEDRRICLDAGMDDYVAKPVRLADLTRVLSDAAEGAGITTDPA